MPMWDWNLDWERIQYIWTYKDKAPLLFNSGTFFLLFMAFFGIYILLRNQRRTRILYTIVFSLFFYYLSSGFYFWVLIVSTIIDYYIGNGLHRLPDGPKRTGLLVLSLCSNLGLLAYFKYVNFGIETFNAAAGTDYPLTNIFLPVGISFYTFQTLSYSIDIYRRNLEPAKNIFDFGFFVSFFPQLVAGPIVRAADFIPQIYQKLQLKKYDMSRAFYLIAGGLFKKAVISDYLSVNFVDRVFDNPLLYSGFENLTAVYAYAFQIYCDFSGYSDMAIGLSLLLGFKLPDNFHSPYQSGSITEFWRRWHISLSSWLKDYLYISIGGNRKSSYLTYLGAPLAVLALLSLDGFVMIRPTLLLILPFYLLRFLFPKIRLFGLLGLIATVLVMADAVYLQAWVSLVILKLVLVFWIINLLSHKIKVNFGTYGNLLMTMLIGGLWHGASWKFVIWGALHGGLLALEKLFWKLVPAAKGNKWLRPIGAILTFHFVCFAWIFFRAADFQQAELVIDQILTGFSWSEAYAVVSGYKMVFSILYLALILHMITKQLEDDFIRFFDKTSLVFKALYLATCMYIVLQIANADVQPFI